MIEAARARDRERRAFGAVAAAVRERVGDVVAFDQIQHAGVARGRAKRGEHGDAALIRRLGQQRDARAVRGRRGDGRAHVGVERRIDRAERGRTGQPAAVDERDRAQIAQPRLGFRERREDLSARPADERRERVRVARAQAVEDPIDRRGDVAGHEAFVPRDGVARITLGQHECTGGHEHAHDHDGGECKPQPDGTALEDGLRARGRRRYPRSRLCCCAHGGK